MQYIMDSGAIQVAADCYVLSTRSDRPYISLKRPNGNNLLELFIPSSVHPISGRDDTLSLGDWQFEESGGALVLSIEAQSSVWERKIYRFRCFPERLVYEVEVHGAGEVFEVDYFGGYYSGKVRWGSGFFWSEGNFLQGFNPEPNSDEVNYFQPAEGSQIDLMGVPLPGKGHWFFTPPPFFYAFEDSVGWVGLGVEAEAGEHNFTEYRFHGRLGAFHLSLSMEGYTAVAGVKRLPVIGIDFAPTEFETLALHVHQVNERLGWKRSVPKVKPVWWYEPIFCGWGAQCHTAAVENGRSPDYSRQVLYNRFLDTLAMSGIHPGVVVLDDKWQCNYAENDVDIEKWPDLAGFVREQHNQNRKVLLWLKAWDPEGLPVEECIRNAAGVPVGADPTHPEYEQRLRKSVRNMLGASGYGADGFKVDFTARIPSGPGMQTYGCLWGLELMKRYLWIIYDEAKQVKSDALVMTHTPHPYLADVVDMIRLNDINANQDVNQAMTHRAKVASIACPEAVIDTDNWPVPDKASWRSYLALQPSLGVPSLYFTGAIDSSRETLDADDYALIREIWSQHRANR